MTASSISRGAATPRRSTWPRKSEPDIFQALHFGAVLENVVLDEIDRHVDFSDARITENTRGAYPIEFIRNAKIPAVAGHPTDVIFLTCDAFGVLPPVSRLRPAQAMYHFISGYTAKVAGTEVGVTEPQATFSACFGGPFLVWHPTKYAELLAAKMRQHHAERLAGQHRLERRQRTASAVASSCRYTRSDHRRDPLERTGHSPDDARPDLRIRRRHGLPRRPPGGADSP